MNVFLPCHCTGDFTDFIGIVQLTKTDISKLLARKNTFWVNRTNDPDLDEISYWDGSVEWYEVGAGLYKKDYDKLLKIITNNEPRVLSPHFRMSKHSMQARVECERVVIDDRGFRWKCYPKHTDQRVDTSYVQWKVIE